MICPYSSPLSPGISIVTANKTLPMPGVANDGDSEHDSMCNKQKHRCPAELFQAKSFCANQQAMVDSLREKVERFRRETEAMYRQLAATGHPDFASPTKIRSKKRRAFKLRNSRNDTAGDRKLAIETKLVSEFNQKMGEPRTASREANKSPDKAHGDPARNSATISPKHEIIDIDNYGTKSRKIRSKLRTKVSKARRETRVEDVVTSISVPSFNARMGL